MLEEEPVPSSRRPGSQLETVTGCDREQFLQLRLRRCYVHIERAHLRPVMDRREAAHDREGRAQGLGHLLESGEALGEAVHLVSSSNGLQTGGQALERRGGFHTVRHT